jgi:N-formylglutamate amidohydrolase
MNSSFDQSGPDTPQWPVILSVPHAGRAYPPDLADDCRFPADRLLPLEDRLADQLVAAAFAAGFTGIVARTPRAVIDLNRAERDMDPGMLTRPMDVQPILSAKARGGLGLVPRRTAALGDLWRRRFSPEEIAGRIDSHHRPYHNRLEILMDAARRRHGAAILLDIHSMPPLLQDGTRPAPQIVVGDRFGRSASSVLTEIAGATFEAAGLQVAYNAPYAGGHILDRHSSPADGLHAIQLEFDRRLYLDPHLRTVGDGLTDMTRLLRQVAERLSDAASRLSLPIAAE